MSYSSFSAKLQQLRNNMGWSQGDLADKLNLATSTISMYERGQREPSIGTITDIANVFGVTVDELMGDRDMPKTVVDLEMSPPDLGFGYYVMRRTKNGKKEVIELLFKGSQPVLSVNGKASEFSMTYGDLLPEDKIAVCRAMLDRAKDELIRG